MFFDICDGKSEPDTVEAHSQEIAVNVWLKNNWGHGGNAKGDLEDEGRKGATTFCLTVDSFELGRHKVTVSVDNRPRFHQHSALLTKPVNLALFRQELDAAD